MYPILYPANSTAFTNQGLGALSDAVSCTVTEERDGKFELEMDYPAQGLHLDELTEGMLIKAKANDYSDPQIFRIYAVSKEFGGIVTVYGEHISYELNDYPVLPQTSKITCSAQALWNKFANGDSSYTPPIAVGGRFTFTAYDSTPKEFKIDEIITLRQLLGGYRESILNKLKGEYEFDNFSIRLHQHRGSDTGVTIKYGKDLTDLSQDISVENLFTRVFPHATKYVYSEGDSEPTETIVYAPAASSETSKGSWRNRVLLLKKNGVSLESAYGFMKVLFLDLTDQFDSGSDFSEADVLAKCETYISDNPGLLTPQVTITVSFEPKRVAPNDLYSAKLEKVGLCDIVRVVYPLYAIDEKLRVNKTVYDVLAERLLKIEIGAVKSTFADSIRR